MALIDKIRDWVGLSTDTPKADIKLYKAKDENKNKNMSMAEIIPTQAVSGAYVYDTNPDDNLSCSYSIKTVYDPIAKNPVVAACDELIRSAVLQIPYMFTCQNNYGEHPEFEEIDNDILSFVENTLSKMDYCSFMNVLDNLMDARKYGFVIAEKVFKFNVDMNKWCINKIKVKPVENFDFETDKYDNLTAIIYNAPDGQMRIDNYDKLIIASYPYIISGNYYGKSEFYEIKDDIDLLNDLECYQKQGFKYICGKPLIHAYDALSEDGGRNEINKVNEMENWSIMHVPGMTVIDEQTDKTEFRTMCEISVMDSRADSEGLVQVKEKIDEIKKDIKRKLGVPDEIGITSDQGGSYAKAKTQLNIFWSKVEKTHYWLEDIINKQLIQQLIDLNYDIPENYQYPVMKFEETDQQVTQEKAMVIDTLIKSGVVKDWEQWIRQYLNLPEFNADDKPEEDQAPEMPSKEGSEEVEEEPVDNPNIQTEDNQYSLFKREYKVIPEHKIVNFQRINDTYNRVEDTAINAQLSNFNDLKKWYLKKIETYINNQDQSVNTYFDLDTNSKYGKSIKNGYRVPIVQMTADGTRESMSELDKEGIKSEKYAYNGTVDEFENLNKSERELMNDLLKTYGIKLNKDAKQLLQLTLESITNTTQQQLERIAGQIKYAIIEQKRISGTLTAKDLQSLTLDIQKVFSPYTDLALTSAQSLQPYSIENTIRTESAKAFNNARMATFRAPEYNIYIKGFEYSAVLDTKTSEFCRAHDRQQIAANDPVLETINPPNHYQCRSLLIAVNITEDNFKPNWNYNIQPDKDFGGVYI